MSTELNIVMITATIPLLRPLFRRQKRRLGSVRESDQPQWDTVTLNSFFSKKAGARSNGMYLSNSSQENIVPAPIQEPEPEPDGITVTREVSVSYQPSNVPFVHASLVGLIQGEIANPRLVRR